MEYYIKQHSAKEASMKKYNAFFYLIFMYVVFTGECVFYHYMTGKINEGADI